MVGKVLAAEIATQPATASTDEEALHAHCRTRLEEPAIPRVWEEREDVPVGQNMKTELNL